jgi:hypothetical protein
LRQPCSFTPPMIFIYFVPVFDSAKRKPAAPSSCRYSFGLG